MKKGQIPCAKEFETSVEKLRQELSQGLSAGQLAPDFHSRLEQTLQQERQLLTALLPYYREQVPGADEITVDLAPFPLLGGEAPDNYLTHFYSLNPRLFAATHWDGKVQMLRLLENQGRTTAQWGPLISVESGLSFGIAGKESILLLGAMEKAYFLTGENEEKATDEKEPAFYPVEISPVVEGFDSGVWLGGTRYVVQVGEKGLTLLSVTDTTAATMDFSNALILPGVTTLTALSSDEVAAGTDDGRVFLVSTDGEKLAVKQRIPALSAPVRQLILSESSDEKTLFVLGDQGQYAVVTGTSRWGAKEKVPPLEGNLFAGACAGETAVFLSDEGLIYLLEKQLSGWVLREDVTQSDCFFTAVVPVDRATYLLLDVENKPWEMKIHRLDSPEKLWEFPLYG